MTLVQCPLSPAPLHKIENFRAKLLLFSQFAQQCELNFAKNYYSIF